ncbi:MAG: TolC family protein [Candidatus Rifleibacteriota bacterium]
MSRNSNRVKILLLLTFLFLFSIASSAETIKVALVLDGGSEAEIAFAESLRSELEKMATDYDDIVVPQELVFHGNNDKVSIIAAIEKAVSAKEADALVCAGPLGSHLAAIRGKHVKPTFASQVINARIQLGDLADPKKARKNLNFINLNLDLTSLLDNLQQIRLAKSLAFIVDKNWQEIMPEMHDALQKLAELQGLKFRLILAEEAISGGGPAFAGFDAALVAPLNSLSEQQVLQLADMIAGAGMVSMSMIGSRPVEQGLFAGIYAEADRMKLARKLSLNLQRLLFDEDPATFDTAFTLNQRLSVNMKTARKLGVYPTWAQMTDAILFNAEPEDLEMKLSLTQVIETAVTRNLQLAAKRQEVEAGRHGVERARSNLRPKISLFARENVLDDDRAETIMTPAKYTTQIGTDLMQVLFNEPARANIDIQKLMLAAKKDEEKALILDIMRDAALAYLNVLKTKTLQAIQRDNLEVTRANLEIAKFREEVGTSGPAEVYRWEIQMASARQAVIDASVMRKKAELALNQILNSQQEGEFTTADCDIFAKVFLLDQQKVAPYLDNMFGFKVFRDFLVKDTLARAPEINQLENAIDAQKRAHRSARRRYNNPTVALQGNFTRTLKESGLGEPKPPMPAPFSGFFKYPDKNDWYVGLNVSIPLHEGGDRPAAIRQAKASLLQLENNLAYMMQRLELNTRATLEDARASFASIGLSKTRSEYAVKALELVQNAYQRGAVNILDLIDAQNASLVSKEASANAMFNFFSDFVRVCRAVGSFEFILNKDSQGEWRQRLHDYYQENGRGAVIERKPVVPAPEREVMQDEKVLYESN